MIEFKVAFFTISKYPHGTGTSAWIRNSENSELDPDPDPE